MYKDDDNFENDKLTLKRFLKMNKISSKIFHDIKIDNLLRFALLKPTRTKIIQKMQKMSL